MIFSGDKYTIKPWGYEYLVGQTEDCALWCLNITENKSTSFHCHPRKKTGYIVIEGVVGIEFLSGSRILGHGEYLNLRPGLFHKTTCISQSAIILEIESPNVKTDLLRLEDGSGRKDSSIEPPVDNEPPNSPSLRNEFYKILEKGESSTLINYGARLIEFSNIDQTFRECDENDFLMVIAGGIKTNINYNQGEPAYLLSIGDVIGLDKLRRILPVASGEDFFLRALIFSKRHDKT